MVKYAKVFLAVYAALLAMTILPTGSVLMAMEHYKQPDPLFTRAEYAQLIKVHIGLYAAIAMGATILQFTAMERNR